MELPGDIFAKHIDVVDVDWVIQVANDCGGFHVRLSALSSVSVSTFRGKTVVNDSR